MIPKIIHYCWFGGHPMQQIHNECLNSWKEHLPDYEIIKWDETNSPIESTPFVRSAYQNKMWAFVADYVRFYALLHHGGIYMDTDMLLLKSLNDLLHCKAFAGFENSNTVSLGIIGAESHHPFLLKCMNWYHTATFDPDRLVFVPRIVSNILRDNGLAMDGKQQQICEVDLLPTEYFYPYPFSAHKKNPHSDYRQFITSKTFAVHLWNSSWRPKRKSAVRKLRSFLKRIRSSICTYFKKT